MYDGLYKIYLDLTNQDICQQPLQQENGPLYQLHRKQHYRDGNLAIKEKSRAEEAILPSLRCKRGI